MSFEKISQDFSTDGYSPSYRQTFGEGGGRAVFPRYRLVILSLSLLNAVLLIAAVVTGIYCAKAKDFQVPNSVATPLIIELNYLRNNSGIIKEKLESQAALAKERTNNQELKLEVRQKKTLVGILQGQIKTLQTETSRLHSNKTILEETCGRCLPGWVLLKTTCYYFSQPELNSKKNWTESRADCINRGGDLLVINNLEEQLLISVNYPKVSSSSIWWQNGFWMGLTDVVTRGTWVWINNVTQVETLYWRDGQPITREGQNLNCAAFFYFSDNMKTWYNGDCHNYELNWICEMESK